MSEQHPPSGTPEYLESGTGAPLPPEGMAPADASAPKRRGRRAWWIGGGAVVLLGAGAGTWAAMSFFQQGTQPAEALPSTTVGYVSIDLDPSGGQKIDAFRTLNKFPAFKDQVGVNSVDDIRRKVGEAMISGADCTGLTYDHDIDPWLGDRAAAAAVDTGDSKPALVVVVQVKDDDKARAGLRALDTCAPDSGPAGFVVHDGWAVVAQSQQVADEVTDATAKGTLADDATYQKWTKAVGDAGVVNAYVSPAAGRLLAGQLSGLLQPYSFTTPDGLPSTVTSSASSATSARYTSKASTSSSGSGAATDDTDNPLTQALSGFKGGALTIRFTGDGLEMSAAGDGGGSGLSELTGTTGGELVSRMPDDTAAALGVSLAPGWLGRRLDAISQGFGGMTGDDATRELSRATGLKIPDDIETLLGSGVALSVSKDLDLEAAQNSSDGTGVPVAATIKGDSTAIQAVLDKIRVKTGDVSFLGSDSSNGLVVLGPTPDYRQKVLSGGALGDDDAFRGVVADAAHASSVFYVNVDDLEPMITKAMAGESQEDLANLTPLRAIGLSTSSDNGVTRFSFKLTTD
jgi:hypothetical protein